MKLVVPLTMLLSCAMALAQQAVDVEAEPHYHLLLGNDQVRVFLLTLATDESALVHFRHSFLTIALQDGEVIIWDEGKSPIQHFQVHKGETSFVWLTQDQQTKGVSGGFRNDRPGNYRNITIEFLDPAVGWAQMGNGTISPPASMFLGGALVADVLLQPSDEFPAPEKPGAELVIPLNEVHLKGANTVRVRNSIGEVAWIPAEAPSKITKHRNGTLRVSSPCSCGLATPRIRRQHHNKLRASSAILWGCCAMGLGIRRDEIRTLVVPLAKNANASTTRAGAPSATRTHSFT